MFLELGHLLGRSALLRPEEARCVVQRRLDVAEHRRRGGQPVEDFQKTGAGVHVRGATERHHEPLRAQTQDQLAEASTRGVHHVEALGVERDHLRRLDERRSVTSADAGVSRPPVRIRGLDVADEIAQRVHRPLAAVGKRQGHAFDAGVGEAVLERGRGLARRQDALEASRARERARDGHRAAPPRFPGSSPPAPQTA